MRTDSADKIADQLKRIGNELLVRNGRAGAEIRDAVRLVAEELERTADKLRTSGPALATLRDDATVQGHLALLEAKDRLLLLEDLVKRALSGAAESPTFIGETARMKLALAKMEAADLFEEKRRAFRDERRRMQASTEAALADLEKRLMSIVDDSKQP